jgi:hypothetical protein
LLTVTSSVYAIVVTHIESHPHSRSLMRGRAEWCACDRYGWRAARVGHCGYAEAVERADATAAAVWPYRDDVWRLAR